MGRKREIGRLITISGTDGSGKTTLCIGIRNHLEHEGKRVAFLYGRYMPRMLRMPFKLWRRIENTSSNGGHYADYVSRRGKALSRTIAYATYKNAVLVDYILFTIPEVRKAIRHNDFVICDRYIYDTLAIDLCLSRHPSRKAMLNDLELLEKFFPAPSIRILLSVSTDAASSRKTDIPHHTYTEETSASYEGIASLREFIEISSDIEKNSLLSSALQIIESKLAGGFQQ